ncbi:hypothetical protein LTR37_018035 [Vermiconidia calcicola]|uniref:Uncharacterized protein n=1 Tax=Vermiconidia calcicola TaxID=1690605 RepID=A0ACC3MI70_9PEZI|nr:hypothetical protein LTR37_018035 [Vermiconidia calcicola]
MPPSKESYSKPCTLCSQPRDVLVRCQIDETGQWHFVCPGKCWKRVSGGVVDGDQAVEHRFYRYGGMWKNKHEAVSAKKPKKSSKKHMSNTKNSISDAEAHEEQEGDVKDADHDEATRGENMA